MGEQIGLRTRFRSGKKKINKINEAVMELQQLFQTNTKQIDFSISDLNNALEQIKSIPEDQHPGINSYEQHRAIAALKRSAINRFLSAYIGQ
ncbi:MAG: hypothetical protein AAF810_01490, partial [Cyanobacteria bacterium P01_D01_bin.36]